MTPQRATERVKRARDFYRYFRTAEYPNGRLSSLRMALSYLIEKRQWHP